MSRYQIGWHASDTRYCHVHDNLTNDDLFDVALYDPKVIEGNGRNARDNSEAHLAELVALANQAAGQEVYVVRPPDPMEDVAAFAREEDAEAFWQTYVDAGEAISDVERVTVCDAALAKRMIAERAEEDEDDG